MIETINDLNDLLDEYKDYVPSIDQLWKKVKSITCKEIDNSLANRTILVYDLIEALLKETLEDIKKNGPTNKTSSQIDALMYPLAILYLKVMNNNDLLQTASTDQLDLPWETEEDI